MDTREVETRVIMKFKELNIDGRIQDALEKLGYSEATEVQSAVIPELKQERDVIVKAKTGSGKTAAFAIPLLDSVVWEENKPQVLVLTPTRELAIQVKEDFDNIGTYCSDTRSYIRSFTERNI